MLQALINDNSGFVRATANGFRSLAGVLLLAFALVLTGCSEEHPDNKPGAENNPFPDVSVAATSTVSLDPVDSEMQHYVVALLSRPAPAAGSIRYRTLAGTAAENRDFVTAIGSITFAAGERQVSIPVTLLNDKERLNDRSFSVELTGATNAVLTGNTIQLVTLSARNPENDKPDIEPSLLLPAGIHWVAPTQGVVNYSVVIPLSQRLTAPASVEIRAIPGTARLGEHFQAIEGANCSEGVCTLSPGQSELSFLVPLIGATAASTRSFNLQFLSPVGLELPQEREITVDLRYQSAPDVEEPSLNVPQTLTLRMPETAARAPLSYPVVLTLSSALQQDAAIEWRTVSDTAIAGEHFVAVDNTGGNATVLNAGAREFAFDLALLHDPNLTENVSFQVQLVSADGVALPSERHITVEVVNSNPGAGTTPTVIMPSTITFHEPTVDTDFTIRLPLSEAMSLHGDIRVTLLEGTAKSGIDFEAFDSMIVIPENSTELAIPVRLLFNPEVTNDRSFRIELATPFNVILPNQRSFEVVIIDSGSNAPEPTLQLTPSNIRVPTPREPGPQQTVTLYFPLTDALSTDASVTIRSLNGTAAAGVDFVEVAEVNHTLFAGATELSLDIGLLVTGVTEQRSFDLRFTNPQGLRLPESPFVTVQIDPLDTSVLPTIDVPTQVQFVAPQAGEPNASKRRTVVIPFDGFAPLPGRFVVRVQDRSAREGIEFTLVEANVSYNKGVREVLLEFDVEPVNTSLDFDLILETATNVLLSADEEDRTIRIVIVPF